MIAILLKSILILFSIEGYAQCLGQQTIGRIVICDAYISDSTNINRAYIDSIVSGKWYGDAIGVQHGGTGATSQSGALNNILPSQTGQTGKLLTTDGDNAYWTLPAGSVTSIGNTSSLGHLQISNSPITTSGNIDLNLSTSGVVAGTYEFVTVDAYGRITNGYNSVRNTLSSRSFNTAYQASDTTRNYDLDFTVRIDIGATLISLNFGFISVETSSSSSGPWTEYTRIANGNGGLASAQNQQGSEIVVRNIPAGYWYRLTTGSPTGTVTYTYITGHEILKK